MRSAGGVIGRHRCIGDSLLCRCQPLAGEVEPPVPVGLHRIFGPEPPLSAMLSSTQGMRTAILLRAAALATPMAILMRDGYRMPTESRLRTTKKIARKGIVGRRKNQGILDLLTTLPWCASIVVSVGVYCGIAWILPALTKDSVFLRPITEAMKASAWFFALVFLFPAPIAVLNAAKRHKLLETQRSLESLRTMDWRDFEVLVGEAFRRQGYRVEQRGGDGPDGGIDLALYREGGLSIVQCKRWRNTQVSVTLVRELFGVMNAEHASEAIFVSSGTYTPDAQAFATGKPIRLIDGQSLLNMIAVVRATPSQGTAPTGSSSDTSVSEDATCPLCASMMVKRTAKAGSRAGQMFWGCSRFPACRGTRPVV